MNLIDNNGLLLLCNCLLKNQVIKCLHVDHNLITDDGAFFVSELLKHNSTLKELNLGGNKISNVGADRIRDSLKHFNVTLTHLGLYENLISKDRLEEIAVYLKRNRQILEQRFLIPSMDSKKCLEIFGNAVFSFQS